MFSQPVPTPSKANYLPFVLTYVLKYYSTRKARAPCNGYPHMQGIVTIGDRHAASLDQAASKTYWTMSVEKGNIVLGADASNAFAEAPAPKSLLYI